MQLKLRTLKMLMITGQRVVTTSTSGIEHKQTGKLRRVLIEAAKFHCISLTQSLPTGRDILKTSFMYFSASDNSYILSLPTSREFFHCLAYYHRINHRFFFAEGKPHQ